MVRKLIVHCQFMPEDLELVFFPINTRTNQWEITPIECDANNTFQVDRFFRRFANVINPRAIKAIVFISTDNEFKTFATAYYFREKLRYYCKKHGIFYSFPTQDSLHIFGALLTTKVMVEEGEEVLFIRSRVNYSTGQFDDAEAMLVVRKESGYQFVKTLDKIKYVLSQQWKKKFLQGSTPKKVIILRSPHDSSEYADGMLAIFRAENAVLCNFGLSLDVINEPIIKKVLHDMGEKISPYFVSPMFLYNFQVKCGEEVLTSVSFDRGPPFNESFVIDVDPTKTVTFTTKEPLYAIIEKIKLSDFKCKKVKVILKIDINSFYNFKVEPVEEEEKLDNPKPSSSDTSSPAKLRLTFDKQNFSVCIVEDGKEKVIPNADGNVTVVLLRLYYIITVKLLFIGLDKTPIYIAFTEIKPIIGKAAMEMNNEKPEFVVFDLIKLCSITSADVVNPKWKFTLSKEGETIMVTMQTSEGERQSSVEFLLAVFLHNAFKIVKNEIGERVNDVEIKFADFIPNETLKKNFIAAGKLMNVNTVIL